MKKTIYESENLRVVQDSITDDLTYKIRSNKMKKYTVTVTINVLADDEDHAIEQALEQMQDGQFTPEVKEQ